MKKIDLGCGKSKKEGFIGIDNLDFPNIDIKYDLNKFPYPFKDDEIDEVWMDQVLEHLDEPLRVIEEIYRICKNNAKITIGVPYFRSFYSVIDPTHKNFFGINWFNYFNPDHLFFKKYSYLKVRFAIDKIEFDREFFNKRGFFYKIIKKIANKYPGLYEHKISHLYPLNSLTFHLRVIK